MAERKGKKGWRVVWLTSLGLVAVILVSPLVLQRSTTSELDVQIARAKALGIPTSAGDMVRNPPVPDSENAAPLYKAAASMFKSAYFQPGSPGDPAYRKEVEGQWLANAKALDLFFRATSKPHCDFGPRVETPQSFRVILLAEFALLSGSKAEILSHDGQIQGALELLSKISPASEHLNENPDLINVLVSLMVLGTIDAQVSSILAKSGRTPGIAETAQNVLASEGPDPDMARTLGRVGFESIKGATGSSIRQGVERVEGANAKAVQKSGSSARGIIPDTSSVRGLGLVSNVPGVEQAWQIARWKRTISEVSAAKRPNETLEQLGQAYDAAVAAEKRGPVSGMYAREYAYPGRGAANSFGEIGIALSEHRVLEQASAILISWNKTGKIPDGLPLSGKAAFNAYDNTPIHFLRTDNGFKLWTHFPGKPDHGGTKEDELFEFPAARSRP